ncbi:MAG: Fe-S protein assembly chaperone HscA, partial [Massilia sp.]
SDTDLLSPDEQAAIAGQLQMVRDAVAMSNDTTLEPGLRQNVVHDAVQALAHGTEEFAARRMDKSVRKALSGKSLDEI